MASIRLITLSISSLPKHTSKLTFFVSKFISTTQSTRLSVMAAAAPSATTTPTAATVVPAVISGGGRMGRTLQEMGGGQDWLVKRGDFVPLDFEGPILVVLGMMILTLFLNPLPSPGGRIWFLLEPWLQSKVPSDADQVVAYFAVSKLGEPPVDGQKDTNPEGLTAAHGKWASAVAARLHAGGLSCKVSNLIAELASAEKGITFDAAIEDYVLTPGLLPTSQWPLKSSNGGMVGSILSLKRQSRKGDWILVLYILHGLRS